MPVVVVVAVCVVLAAAAGWLAINADVDCVAFTLESSAVDVCVCASMFVLECVCEPKVLQRVDFVDLAAKFATPRRT